MPKKFYTYELALEFYRDCQALRLKEPIRSQFERALLSIVLNLAEGSTKPTKKDRIKFYHIALGSQREVFTLLNLIPDSASVLKKADSLGICLYKLCKQT